MQGSLVSGCCWAVLSGLCGIKTGMRHVTEGHMSPCIVMYCNVSYCVVMYNWLQAQLVNYLLNIVFRVLQQLCMIFGVFHNNNCDSSQLAGQHQAALSVTNIFVLLYVT